MDWLLRSSIRRHEDSSALNDGSMPVDRSELGESGIGGESDLSLNFNHAEIRNGDLKGNFNGGTLLTRIGGEVSPGCRDRRLLNSDWLNFFHD